MNNIIVKVRNQKVWCNGMHLEHPLSYLEMDKESVTGHPKIYLTMKEGQVRCPYCNRLFVYIEQNEESKN